MGKNASTLINRAQLHVVQLMVQSQNGQILSFTHLCGEARLANHPQIFYFPHLDLI